MSLDSHPSKPAVWDYDAFAEGAELGTSEIALNDEKLQLWRAIFGTADPSTRPGASLLVSAMMEGYLHVAQPRPAGNIHAGQMFSVLAPLLPNGGTIRVTTSCKQKYVRKDRKWIRFESRISHEGTPVAIGEMLIIWAK